MKRTIKNLNHAESGVVSILVCMIMMIVITLIVLGFSQLSNNEVQQTLDRQLSAEAFYAANSGINNAAAIIQADVASATTPPSQTSSCGQAGSSIYNRNAYLSTDPQHTVSYSCVIVNPSPTKVKYTVKSGEARTFPISISVPLTELVFNWDASGVTAPTYDSCPITAEAGSFAPSDAWSTGSATCDAGVLQLDLISQTNSQTIATQETNTYSLFLVPTSNSSPGTVTTLPATPKASTIADAYCSKDSKCQAIIKLPTGGSEQTYYLHVASIYEDSALDICANSPTCAVPIDGVQADVDVTGRAQNVLQRLDAQVSLSALDNGETPANALQTGSSLCKLIQGYPGVISTGSADPGCSVDQSGQSTGTNIQVRVGVTGCKSNCGNPGGNGPTAYSGAESFVNLTDFPAGDSADTTKCTWDFGDGSSISNRGCTPATGTNDCVYKVTCVEHTYAFTETDGKPVPASTPYTVTLTEYDIHGVSNTISYTVNIPYSYNK